MRNAFRLESEGGIEERRSKPLDTGTRSEGRGGDMQKGGGKGSALERESHPNSGGTGRGKSKYKGTWGEKERKRGGMRMSLSSTGSFKKAR